MRTSSAPCSWVRLAVCALVSLALASCALIEPRRVERPLPGAAVEAPAGNPAASGGLGGSNPFGELVAPGPTTDRVPTSPGDASGAPPSTSTTTPQLVLDPRDPRVPDPRMVSFSFQADTSRLSPACRANYELWSAVVALVTLASYQGYEAAKFLPAMDRVAEALASALPLQAPVDRAIYVEVEDALRRAQDRLRAAGSQQSAASTWDTFSRTNAPQVADLMQVAARSCPELISPSR